MVQSPVVPGGASAPQGRLWYRSSPHHTLHSWNQPGPSFTASLPLFPSLPWFLFLLVSLLVSFPCFLPRLFLLVPLRVLYSLTPLLPYFLTLLIRRRLSFTNSFAELLSLVLPLDPFLVPLGLFPSSFHSALLPYSPASFPAFSSPLVDSLVLSWFLWVSSRHGSVPSSPEVTQRVQQLSAVREVKPVSPPPPRCIRCSTQPGGSPVATARQLCCYLTLLLILLTIHWMCENV